MRETDAHAGPLRRTLRLVGPDVKPQWGMVLAGVIVLLFEVAFRVMEPWPLKIVIDSVLPALTPNSTRAPASVRFLLLCGLMLVAIVAMRAVCNYVATVCFALVGSRTSARLRARVFRHVQRLSQEFHSRNRSADTVQRIVSDVARMQDVAISAGMPLLANIATLVVMLGVMFWLDPLLASVVVVAILIFWLTSRGSSSRITHASRQTRKGEGQLANTAQESLSSIKVVQAYGLEAKIEERFVGANRVSLLEGVKALRLAARLERSTDVIVGLATAAVIVGGGLRVLDGAMTPGELVLFVTYLRTTMKPLRDMAKYTGRIARAGASGERVADLMAITPTIQTPAVPVLPPHFVGNLRFNDVHTQYENSPVLKGVDLALGPGEYVAIIGPSGAGKSTLVNLVTRAQDPTFGQVTLDDVPLPQLDLNHLRANVSVLHQEAVLFAGTIRENIRLGRAAATDAEIEAAARAAHAHDFICRLPAGYDTTVGERGGTLSGGQRQRIAIARALLRSAPVVVLDEATTGLDPESAGLVLDAIDQLVAGRTTLAVTHDVEVALRATRVVWLEAGRVLLDGPPQQLLVDSPAFRDWVAAARPPRQIDPAGSQ
ncbi:ABC transporter ATP-binding protein [Buchananella hordeovulneris]|uniref:ABC transporter ATP-binding protein n=1 Tax=Buchananella hordeovulneris TaxID=52770 RepID=UPI000AF533E8|nr:ABC transporter ATP-binding protein [Buchananella hordeovulneris]